MNLHANTRGTDPLNSSLSPLRAGATKFLQRQSSVLVEQADKLMKVLPNLSLISRWDTEILDLKAPALHLLPSDSNSSLAFHLPPPASVFQSGLLFLEQLVIDVRGKKEKRKNRGHWLNRYGCKNRPGVGLEWTSRFIRSQTLPSTPSAVSLFNDGCFTEVKKELFVKSPPLKKIQKNIIKKFNWSFETFLSKSWRKMDAIMIKVIKLIYLKAFNVLLLIPEGDFFCFTSRCCCTNKRGNDWISNWSTGIFGLLSAAAASLTDLM